MFRNTFEWWTFREVRVPQWLGLESFSMTVKSNHCDWSYLLDTSNVFSRRLSRIDGAPSACIKARCRNYPNPLHPQPQSWRRRRPPPSINRYHLCAPVKQWPDIPGSLRDSFVQVITSPYLLRTRGRNYGGGSL